MKLTKVNKFKRDWNIKHLKIIMKKGDLIDLMRGDGLDFNDQKKIINEFNI